VTATTAATAAAGNWRTARDTSGIVTVTLDVAGGGANVLSTKVMRELDDVVDAIAKDRAAAAVLFTSARDGVFIAGADIREFAGMTDTAAAAATVRAAHRTFARIAALRPPTVAVINGHCLGGGLELALACDYRVCVDDDGARLGLPEVLLGIHPGFGGTARLARIAGPLAAMELMLSGRTVRPRDARKLKLVDQVAPRRHLERAAALMVERHPARQRAGFIARLGGTLPARKLFARIMRRKAAVRAPREHYPAPHALIDLWERHGGGEKQMLRAEADSVARLLATDAAQNLVRVFFLREKLKSAGKTKPAGGEAGQPRRAPRVHVVGAGVMGGDIAAWCALHGLQVTVEDADAAALARATARAAKLFRRKLRRPRAVTRALDLFTPDPAGYGAARADVIIEAIAEDAEAKRALFRKLEVRAAKSALLATNTSSIPLETLGAALREPQRLIGLHFFNPVARMQLVEVVRGAHSTEAAVRRGAEFARRINRLPLPVKSAPGFLVNRILTPYLMEAVELMGEGVAAETVDRAALRFGMPMGPVELADTVGLDICASVAGNLGVAVPQSLQGKVQAGNLGKKTARGFYRWKNGKPRKNKNAADADATITDRTMLRFLNEAVACEREGIVADADMLDAGVIFATGFAPFRGGPMRHIQTETRTALREKLTALAAKHGRRFTPDAGWDG